MAEGNLKSKAIKLVGKIVEQMEEHAQECDPSLENNIVSDERVEALISAMELALCEAHALGVVAGRDEGL